MFFIVGKAEPAEFVATFTTSHVHATLVLLNRNFAFGAILCVQFQPIQRIFFTSVSAIGPQLQYVAVSRLMCILIAAEAESLSTVASGIDWMLEFSFTDHFAVASRTPLCKI